MHTSSCFCLLAVLVGATPARSDEKSFRAALSELPPKFLGDIPLEDRAKFLNGLEKDPSRMDARNGWLHSFSDGRDIRGTSMIWARELPRPEKASLILVHMAKPFATGVQSGKDLTFVLEHRGKEWVDVTKQVMPSDVDLTMHFRTWKSDSVVEVAAWKQIERYDGRGFAVDFGPRTLDLTWDGKRFAATKAATKTLTKN